MSNFSDHCITQANNGAVDYPLALGASEGVCFLYKVGGEFTGLGETVSVEPVNNAWHIRINTSAAPIHVCARCIIY